MKRIRASSLLLTLFSIVSLHGNKQTTPQSFAYPMVPINFFLDTARQQILWTPIYDAYKNAATSVHVNVENNARSSTITEQEQIQELSTPLFSPTQSSDFSFKDFIPSKTTCYIAGGISFIALYFGIVFYLKKAESIINNPHSWCNWKNELSPDKFFGNTKEILAEDLIAAIQNEYCNVKNPTDLTQPLHLFLQEYTKELTIFKRYLSITHLIAQCRCLWLFPTQKEVLELKIKERIERLTFLRSLFFEWVTHHRSSASVIL